MRGSAVRVPDTSFPSDAVVFKDRAPRFYKDDLHEARGMRGMYGQQLTARLPAPTARQQIPAQFPAQFPAQWKASLTIIVMPDRGVTASREGDQ
jgi:hypothetical protein